MSLQLACQIWKNAASVLYIKWAGRGIVPGNPQKQFTKDYCKSLTENDIKFNAKKGSMCHFFYLVVVNHQECPIIWNEKGEMLSELVHN